MKLTQLGDVAIGAFNGFKLESLNQTRLKLNLEKLNLSWSFNPIINKKNNYNTSLLVPYKVSFEKKYFFKMCTPLLINSGLPLCTMVYTFLKNIFFETRCTKYPSFNIGMCSGYSVHFVCTLYGRKMLSALHKFDSNWISLIRDWKFWYFELW